MRDLDGREDAEELWFALLVSPRTLYTDFLRVRLAPQLTLSDDFRNSMLCCFSPDRTGIVQPKHSSPPRGANETSKLDLIWLPRQMRGPCW